MKRWSGRRRREQRGGPARPWPQKADPGNAERVLGRRGVLAGQPFTGPTPGHRLRAVPCAYVSGPSRPTGHDVGAYDGSHGMLAGRPPPCLGTVPTHLPGEGVVPPPATAKAHALRSAPCPTAPSRAPRSGAASTWRSMNSPRSPNRSSPCETWSSRTSSTRSSIGRRWTGRARRSPGPGSARRASFDGGRTSASPRSSAATDGARIACVTGHAVPRRP